MMKFQQGKITRFIKSFEMNDLYDAVYEPTQGDPPSSYVRSPVDGFALVIELEHGGGPAHRCETVEPFEFGDTGFTLCCSIKNFLGVVRRGDSLPEWMMDELGLEFSKVRFAISREK